MSAIPHLADYPPPFQYALEVQPYMVRRALWAIEGGMGGEVEWQTSFGVRQTEVILTASMGAYGKDLGRRKANHRRRR